MKKITGFLLFFIFLSIILYSLIFIFRTPKKIFLFQNFKELFTPVSYRSILFLGKMGPGYYGGENTDSIFLLYLIQNKAYIIHIPRDLIVKIDGNLYKINALYSLKKFDDLIKEINYLTGIKTKEYVVFDSYILKSLINKIGGLKVYLKYPITDAITGYTLYPGEYNLSGDWVEWVVRSRYNPEGDFYRMRNQFIILKAFKNQIENLDKDKLLEIFNLIVKSKDHYDTNISFPRFLEILNQIKNIKNNNIEEIIFDFNSGVWQAGYFDIKVDGINKVYGLIPKNGIGKYSEIREKIKEKIKD